MIILAVPSQCIVPLLDSIASYVPSWVIFLNLAKGIDISKNKTISSLLKGSLSWKSFEYAVFSGGVFASELVAGKKLWADLWVTNRKVGNEIKKLLWNGNLDICIQENYLNIELYGSFKNIIAIMVGYYEWKWEGLSTISYYIFTFLDELKEVVKLYGGDGDNIDFSSYSLGGDLITTCFWDSRNRYLGRLLGSWKSIRDALMILKLENKHSEWYETIKAVYKKIWSRGGFHITKFLYELMNG
jgi:glycerol-3-phosphate dehydrogenase (NAD(P)+)